MSLLVSTAFTDAENASGHRARPSRWPNGMLLL